MAQKFGKEDASLIRDMNPMYELRPKSSKALFTDATFQAVENDYKHRMVCGSTMGVVSTLYVECTDKDLLRQI